MSEGMKGLVGKKITKSYKFMGETVVISKLTVSEVLEIQEQAKNNTESEEDSFGLLKDVIKKAVDDASELSDDDFNSFPIEELSKLSNEIMKYSGMLDAKGK